jgi:hypothetical protein
VLVVVHGYLRCSSTVVCGRRFAVAFDTYLPVMADRHLAAGFRFFRAPTPRVLLPLVRALPIRAVSATEAHPTRPRGLPIMATPERHPATTGLLRYFEYAHLPEHLQAVSKPVGDLAQDMAAKLPDGPELTTGLRKLLEAKDCLVRAALDARIASL